MKLITLLLTFCLSFGAFGGFFDREPTKPKEIKLTTNNHVLLRGFVGNESMSQLSKKLLKISSKLKKNDTIYVVIDSGGGSVLAGMDFIGVMESIPQKIHTISLFAFSMAYSISQRGDKRFINKRGVMGQHRAKGSFRGQFATGEVESRLKLWTEVMDDLEEYEANRMGLSLKEFKEKIINEMYVYDNDAVDEEVADGVVKISCSKVLSQKTIKHIERGFFGTTTSIFSACPLIRGPLSTKSKLIEFK